MPLKANESTVTHIEVTFVEINRIFDLVSGSLLVEPSGGSDVVYDRSLEPLLAASDWQYANYIDDNGDSVQGEARLAEGVYRGVRVTGYDAFLHGFRRSRSVEIDRKYVYIWSADPKSGKPAELEYELYFEEGSFRKITFDSAENEGKDLREPEGAASKRLLLEVLSFWKAEHAQEGYYFFLAPYQLPWSSIRDLNQTIHIRGVRLWDWFYTDIYTTPDAKSAAAPPHAMFQGKTPERMMFRVHLLDPFKEALQRSARYREMLRRWEPEQARLGKSREYLLAVRVENFLRSDENLQGSVDAWKLLETRRRYECEPNRLLLLSSLRCSELVRWVGAAHCPDVANFPGISDKRAFTWIVEGQRVLGLDKELPGDWHSPFSNAVEDYREADSAIAQEVTKIVYAIHEDLQLTAVGSAWLQQNLARALEKEDTAPTTTAGEAAAHDRRALKEADGGASVLFSSRRKAYQGGAEFNVGLLSFYAPSWVRKYRADALTAAKDFLKRVHGINVKLVEHRGTRVLLSKRVGTLTPDYIELMQLAEKGSDRLSLAIEFMNFCYAANDWSKERGSFYKGLNAAGALIDLYLSVQKLQDRLPNPEFPLYRMGGRVAKFSPLAAASAAIDVATATYDTATARTADEKIMNGVRVAGAALCLGSAFALSTPPGWILLVAGNVIQAGGLYVAGELKAGARFLRFCQWGKGGSLSSGDFRDRQDEFWYNGNLSELACDVEAQLNALDNILFDFQPSIRLEKQGPDLLLLAQMRAPTDSEEQKQLSLIGPDASWKIRVELIRPETGSTPVKVVTAPSADCGNLDLTLGLEFALHTFQWAYRHTKPQPSYPTIEAAPTEPPVKRWDEPQDLLMTVVSAELDVFGDASCIIKRTFTDTRNLWYHW